ncbi:MAG: hypothetical protein KF911_06920 [Pseudomonadales bacterium]|nr:hypothetical protein [Pseudomonadales bacterium]
MNKPWQITVWFAICVSIGLGFALLDGIPFRAVLLAAVGMALMGSAGFAAAALWQRFRKR